LLRIGDVITVSEHLTRIPPAVRPIVQAARRAVKAAAPHAKEVAYQSKPPRSKSAMWKLVHYSVGDEYVVGIGTFATGKLEELAVPARKLFSELSSAATKTGPVVSKPRTFQT